MRALAHESADEGLYRLAAQRVARLVPFGLKVDAIEA
jgi:hypothetical protein